MKAIWTNKKRGLTKQRCVGEYKTWKNRRRFRLVDYKFNKVHIFNSWQAAKALGWVRGE